ncbi:hypothetical protein J2T60_001504 [Natronospira proteinivora]|uniref:RES domain-containing protein n=1 Tax=Natronospira proteinivora TaxID=1807133 RepID=A0ABT1G863_9GAMM|nr:hypothetical protein [Natronospira proteinivora]MCP1727504.1 hypothetical protein [Natronospira proteinivora]
MSQRWLKLLERLGTPLRARPTLADPFEKTGASGDAWYDFRDYYSLFRLYGPPPESVWHPYHCPTLFAGIDRLKLLPRPLENSPAVNQSRPEGAWDWLRPGTMTLIDLPGAESLQLGAALFLERECQLIASYDHWPRANPMKHPERSDLDGVVESSWPPKVNSTVAVDSQDIIDAMVTLAPKIYQRHRLGVAADAPPVWLCDSRRLTAPKPGPGSFDNRYFIDQSILPSLERLKNQGIRGLIYVAKDGAQRPSDDLVGILREVGSAGLLLRRVHLSEPDSWANPLPLQVPAPVRLVGKKFPKSDMGGFGKEIPIPEDSGGGGLVGSGAGG